MESLIEVEYALAIAANDVIVYVFVTNEIKKTINMNFEIAIKDSAGSILGTGGNYSWGIPPSTKQQMFGYPIYKDSIKMVRLRNSDILGPVVLELKLNWE